MFPRGNSLRKNNRFVREKMIDINDRFFIALERFYVSSRVKAFGGNGES